MNDYHLALHGLAIKKHANADEVAELVGLRADAVASLLDRAAASGRAVRNGEKYMLTAPAQVALRGEYSRFYDKERADSAMIGAYDAFEKVNVELKQLITDWQTLEVGGQKMQNDHSDKDYDAKIIDCLAALHERLEPILARMTPVLPRLGVYAKALATALEKAEDGDVKWVSDAKIASYHTVWFEMHEDLLRILGRVRDE